MKKILFALGFGFLLTACTTPPASAPPLPTPTPDPFIEAAMSQAVAYLKAEYNPAIGLIRESPITAPDRYWLATDNQLAVYALGEHDLAAKIDLTINQHKELPHGLIEALIGEVVEWPPRRESQAQVEGSIWNEHRLFGGQYEDWQEYADLALYAALNAHNQGNTAKARRLYRKAMSMFDGIGFADKAYTSSEGHGLYATYKLGLALYVGARIGEPPDSPLLDALLSKQAPSGGFVTLYNDEGIPQGDTNTETTCYAILSLSVLR